MCCIAHPCVGRRNVHGREFVKVDLMRRRRRLCGGGGCGDGGGRHVVGLPAQPGRRAILAVVEEPVRVGDGVGERVAVRLEGVVRALARPLRATDRAPPLSHGHPESDNQI